MSIFGSVARAVHSPDFGLRLQAALAAANGDPNAIYRMREMMRQNAELQLRQQAAQRAEEDRNNQVWGAKEAGYSNPEIALMNPGDLSASARDQTARYTLSPGQESHRPGLGGQPEQVTRAPIADDQMGAWLDTQDPSGGLRRLYAAHQAMPPIATQPGGGVIGAVPNPAGGYGVGYMVQPDTGQQPPTAPGTGTGGGNTARNNPGGLRVPGRSAFQNFPTPQAGVAAVDAQLGRYFGRGLNTIRSIIETWAPRRSRGGDNTDAQVDNYIAHVTGRLGVSPDQPLPPSAIPQIRTGLIEFETGHRPGPNAPRLSVGSASARNAPRLPVRVSTRQEADALPPGTHYSTPDGREFVR